MRPAMRAAAGLALIVVMALLSASCDVSKEKSAAPTTTPAEPSSASAYDDAVLALVNAHRQSIGRAPLAKSQAIWEQANQHSRNMAAGTVAFGHDGFDARTATIRAALGGTGTISENVAAGHTSAESVVNGWLTSAGHKANIESGATRTGISAVQSSGGVWYYTQIFY